jgi:hypothetical protein
MAKKKARKDGWKRVEQGIYKRVWADGSGGALLAKITLPGGGQKNSGSMPYFTNAKDQQATEAAVLKAVRRWRTDNLEAKDIHGQDAGDRQDEQDDMLGYWFTQYIADATLTRVAHDAREKGKTWSAWDVVPLLDHEPESPRERSVRIQNEEAQCRDPNRSEWLRIVREAEAETCLRLDGGLPRGVSVCDTTWTARQDALSRAAAKRGEAYSAPKRQKSLPIPPPFNRPRMGAQLLDTKWAAAKWDRDHAVQVLREQARGIMSWHPTAVDKRALEDVAKEMATRVSQNTANRRMVCFVRVFRRGRDVWKRRPSFEKHNGRTERVERFWWPHDLLPTDAIKWNQPEKAKSPEIITDDDWALIMGQIQTTCRNPDKVMAPTTVAGLYWCRATAARRGNAHKLEWRDITPPKEARLQRTAEDREWVALLRDVKTPTGQPTDVEIPLLVGGSETEDGVRPLLIARAWALAQHAMTGELDDRARGELEGDWERATERERMRARRAVREQLMADLGTPDDLARDLRAGRLNGRVFGGSQDKLTAAWSRLRDRAVSKLEGRREEAERQGDLDQVGLLNVQIERIRNEKLHSMRHSRMTEITSVLLPQDAARFSGHKTLGMVMHYYRTTPANVANKLRAATQQKQTADEQDQLARLISALDDETRQGLIEALQKKASTRD